MVSRKPSAPPPVEVKHFTSEEIERGISKLERRLNDIAAFIPETTVATPGGEALATVLENAIKTTILEVFGPNSPEVRDHEHFSMWGGGPIVPHSEQEVIEGYAAGKTKAETTVRALLKELEEKRADLGGTKADRVRAAFRDLDLHPRIAAVATELYLNGHHNEAVFNASKALVNLVKERSGRYDLDGAELMFTVFSKNAPVLAFSDLANQTDEDEQQGMMHLYAGAVLAIRNPGGHAFPEEAPDRALELIAFLSLLAKRADEAKKRTK